MFRQMLEYFDFKSANNLKAGLTGTPLNEGFRETLDFSPNPPNPNQMNTALSNTNNLQIDWTAIDNPKDFKNINVLDTKVENPYGYGYAPSVEETRNKDAKDILEQEHTNFALGAVAGISLIVAGILLTSISNASS